jgi:hypothetical protein
MIRMASLQRATTDSNGSCFLLEISQFAHQMTCFTGHVIYLWIFLDAGRVFPPHSPLRLGDRSAHGFAPFVLRESHLIGYMYS